MGILRPIRNVIVAASLIVVMAFSAGPAFAGPAEDADTARLQGQLEAIDAASQAVRDEIAQFERMLEEGRTYLVPVLIGDMPMFQFVSREHALRLWTWAYLDTLPDMKAFTAAGLAAFLKEREAESRLLATEIQKHIDLLEEDLVRISRSRAGAEALLAELQEAAAQGSGTGAADTSGAADVGADADVPRDGSGCVNLVKIEKKGALGSKASADIGTKQHSVTRSGKTGRGWTGNFELNWTAPPDQLCIGQEFDVKLVAKNKSPRKDPGLHRAASMGMTFSHPFLTAKCSNPQPFDPRSGVAVGPDEAKSFNTCKVTVNNLVESGPEKAYVYVSLGAIPKTGSLAYIYE